ncbi:hypothetical protein FRB97_006026 [Tulasnella sp. 331]|nr:hypothetical protein FRB97_006026 [Tulasnella sp. 331]
MTGGEYIKVVIVGPSGVGKTSLRHQYISGRFTTGYRATIGTDFITKTLSHYSQRHIQHTSEQNFATDATSPDPSTPPAPGSVTLQIWDTAGQERFSSLSTAFFRGADAVMLVFDVNKPESLQELLRWWDEFRTKVPIQEGREAEYCVVVVGNKTDLLPVTKKVGKEIVGRSKAVEFLRDMIPTDIDDPSPPSKPRPLHTEELQEEGRPGSVFLESGPSSPSSSRNEEQHFGSRPSAPPIQSPAQPPAASTSRNGSDEQHITPRLSQLKLPSESSKFGTMNTARTEISVYHTPSSSFFHSRANSASPTETAMRARVANRLSRIQSQEFDMDMDIENDDIQESTTHASGSGSGGYVTANSMLTQSTSPSIPISSPLRTRSRPHAPSILSESSLSTVRPTNANRNPFLLSEPSRGFIDGGLPLSPPRSRTSTTSSASSTSPTRTPSHEAEPTGLPTPSASPPSPPMLTASLMAAMHQAHELQSAKQPGPKKLDTGPKLFYTSARTGGISTSIGAVEDDDGIIVTPVTEIFDYLAERVGNPPRARDQTLVGRVEAAEAGEGPYQSSWLKHGMDLCLEGLA